LLNLARIEQSFETTHTTSPAGAPLASIDGCRALLEIRGEQLTGDLLKHAIDFKNQVQSHFDQQIFLNADNFAADRFDPVKIVLRANVLGLSGVDVEKELQKANIRVEMADRDTIVFLATLADIADDFSVLANALVPILKMLQGNPRPTQTSLSWSIVPTVAVSMRDAYFAVTELVSASQAIGRISADLIAPYPPGVAVVAPGEVLTEQIVTGLSVTQKAGVRIAYASDPTLATYRVVK
jgi:lysine decarboxylase